MHAPRVRLSRRGVSNRRGLISEPSFVLSEIHWHEGLHLRQHHFQHLWRQILEGRQEELALALPYSHGVIELEFAEDALASRSVRVRTLKAVMPSGRLVDIGGNAELPALDVGQAIDDAGGTLDISLGLPVWRERFLNVVPEDSSAPHARREIFRLAETQWNDENTGRDPQQLVVRQLNARLVIPSREDTAGLELLPLARVSAGASAEGRSIRLSNEFAPPCLRLTGARPIRELVFDVSTMVGKCRDDLASVLHRQNATLQGPHGEQLRDFMQLGILSVASSRLRAMLTTGRQASPFEAYLVLSDLLASLASLDPGEALRKDPYVEYRHEDPLRTFRDLRNRIRALATGGRPENHRRIDFEGVGEKRFASLEKEQLEEASQFFLAVEAEGEREAVRKLVENRHQFKLMPFAEVDMHVYGITLEYDEHAPLPRKAGVFYFRLALQDRESKQAWQKALDEGKVGARSPALVNAEMSLALMVMIESS